LQGDDVSPKVRVGDEILVKIKVNHINENGQIYSTFLSLIHPEEMISICEREIEVGDKFQRNGSVFVVKMIIDSEIGITRQYVMSCEGYIQTNLKSKEDLRKNYKKVDQ
jgi:hypothetical protein